jgi:hypothetical protein
MTKDEFQQLPNHTRIRIHNAMLPGEGLFLCHVNSTQAKVLRDNANRATIIPCENIERIDSKEDYQI